MKIILLSLLLLFIGLVAQAQTMMMDTPPKEADVIIIRTPDNGQDALVKLSRVLTAQGYSIATLDRKLITLVTKPKAFSAGAPSTLTIRAHTSAGPESLITIEGDYPISGKQTTGKANYSTARQGVSRVAFDQLQKAAAAYPGGQLLYGKD
ncbi:hypothetical protein SAMN00120144_4080 [Hymenobacter roseosalivarius DSM 11622]|uniref:Uncharacterized protein n=1 Tax=Hymenobacter roseosalivarius DSM 11622 TaxID=645990 RepID=A0A1W1W4S8_9BACT|nr:hypothetical protein [Hymenobacter roseosalivarius]SMC00638.1 hypothetical protein SAMN00120144_4080 [Hymenobacter roseosalivarius DSM 11622]